MGRPRTPLIDRARITTTALDLIDENGDFSLPRIARRLGVQTGSLYHHVDGRDGVIELVREHLSYAIDSTAIDKALRAAPPTDALTAAPPAAPPLTDTPPTDTALTAAALTAAPPTDAALVDASLADAALVDASLTDAALADLPLTDAALFDAAPTDGALADVPLTGAAQVDASLVDAMTWDQALANWARSYRAAFAAHPRAIPLLMASPVRAPRVLAQYEQIVRMLLATGFALHDVMHVITALENLILGSALDLAAPEPVWELSGQSSTPALSQAVAAASPTRADIAFELALTACMAHFTTLIGHHVHAAKPGGGQNSAGTEV